MTFVLTPTRDPATPREGSYAAECRLREAHLRHARRLRRGWLRLRIARWIAGRPGLGRRGAAGPGATVPRRAAQV